LKTLLTEVECRKDAAWKEKVAQAELRRAEAEEALSKYGLSTVPDPTQPYLVNVNRAFIFFLNELLVHLQRPVLNF
jgi:hypothetical protein